jgi:hypothetical protein
MNPFGKSSSSRRILFALGLAFAGLTTLTTQVLANSTTDINTLLAALNKSLTTAKKPTVTLTTASASELQGLITSLVETGTTGISSGAQPGEASGAVQYILSTLNSAATPVTTVGKAGIDLLESAYAAFPTVGITSSSPFWGDVAEQAAFNYSSLGSSADGDEQKVVTTAITDTPAAYNDIISKVLLVSDPNAAQQALLVDKAVSSSTTASQLQSLAGQIAITDSNTITNSGLFLQTLLSKVTVPLSQQGFVVGFTSQGVGETASQLETTASNIVAGAPSGLNVVSRQNIALGLITSGSNLITTGSDSADTLTTVVADVTGGIVSGYVTGAGGASTPAAADGDRATLASDLITSLSDLPVSYVSTVAGAAALNLNATSADLAAFVGTLAKNADVKLSGTIGTYQSNAIANVASGAGNDFALTGLNVSGSDATALTPNDVTAMGFKVAVAQGVLKDYSTQGYVVLIIPAVIEQILNTNTATSADLQTALTSFITNVCTTSSALSVNDALRGNILAAVAIDASAVPNASTSIPALAAAAAGTDSAKASNVSVIVQPVLAEFLLSGSASTVKAIAAKVAELGNSSSNPTPDALAAALITGAKTTAALVDDIAEGTATDSAITGNSAYGNADGYVAALAHDEKGSATDITLITDSLAATAPFTPVETGSDVATGASSLVTTIANDLAVLYPAQSANIAAAVANTSGVTSDSTREKIGEDVVLALTTSGSTYAVAVSGSVGALLTTNPDKAAFAESMAKESTSTAAGIADAVALTIPSSDTSILPDVALVAVDVVKGVASSAVTTATSVEQIAINDGAPLSTTAVTFATDFVATPSSVPAIASIASAGQNALVSGSIGLAVDEISKVAGTANLAGSVALAVATAATPTNAGGSAADDFNNNLYTVADIFATQSQSTSALLKIDASVAGALAGAVQGGTVNGSGNGANQAAAAIVYDFTMNLASLPYSSNNAAAITAIVEAAVLANPTFAADIYGYAVDALDTFASSGWTATNDKVLTPYLATLESDVKGVSTVVSNPNSAAIDSDVTLSGTDQALFAGGDGGLVTADETTVVNY